jgi:hypothetical protein
MRSIYPPTWTGASWKIHLVSHQGAQRDPRLCIWCQAPVVKHKVKKGKRKGQQSKLCAECRAKSNKRFATPAGS